MKYLKKYENFDTYYPDLFYSKNTILDKNLVNKIENEVTSIISEMNQSDISKLKFDLLNFADKNNCKINELEDVFLLKKLIEDKTSGSKIESMSEYQLNNWKRFCTVIGIGGILAGIILIVIGAVSADVGILKIGIVVQTISKVILVLRKMGVLF